MQRCESGEESCLGRAGDRKVVVQLAFKSVSFSAWEKDAVTYAW